jgi:hypothetical protein
MPCRRVHASVLDMLVAEVVMASRLVRANPVTVNDVLDGHVKLDLEIDTSRDGVQQLG